MPGLGDVISSLGAVSAKVKRSSMSRDRYPLMYTTVNAKVTQILKAHISYISRVRPCVTITHQ